MSDINKVVLKGTMGKDVELRYSGSGVAMADFSLATTFSYKKSGATEYTKETEWHTCKVFDKKAEFLAKNAKKGTRLFVEGRIKTREYTPKNSTQKVYVREIIVEDVELIRAPSPKTEQDGTSAKINNQSTTPKTSNTNNNFHNKDDDDMPF